MKKTPSALIPFSLVVIGFVLACNFPLFLGQPEQLEQTPTLDMPFSSLTATKTLTPTATATTTSTPTIIPETPTMAPTLPGYTPTLETYSTPGMAPFCEDTEAVIQSSCEYPFARQSGAFCVDKSPYNLIALSDGATYELLHNYVQCEEAGVQDGQRNVICTAPMAFYFELKVCDSACTSLQIETDYDRCPFGYQYNNLQNCCTNSIQEVSQGCTVLKLKTISCAFDCEQFKSSSTCSSYGYSCRWDYSTSTCRLRK